MKERPIIFSSEMVCAILKGEKTQTRRVIKPQPKVIHALYSDASIETNCIFEKREDQRIHCPYGAPGDELWVRETWNVLNSDGCSPRDITPQPDRVVYKANEDDQYPFWRPSIFMPRWASRIQLLITDVRVERVRDISVEDAYAEGVRNPFYGRGTVGGDFSVVNVMFQDLWNSINAKRGHSWESNPWVWVIEFEKLT